MLSTVPPRGNQLVREARLWRGLRWEPLEQHTDRTRLRLRLRQSFGPRGEVVALQEYFQAHTLDLTVAGASCAGNGQIETAPIDNSGEEVGVLEVKHRILRLFCSGPMGSEGHSPMGCQTRTKVYSYNREVGTEQV